MESIRATSTWRFAKNRTNTARSHHVYIIIIRCQITITIWFQSNSVVWGWCILHHLCNIMMTFSGRLKTFVANPCYENRCKFVTWCIGDSDFVPIGPIRTATRTLSLQRTYSVVEKLRDVIAYYAHNTIDVLYS